jgi:RNA polymerase-binding transcription factor
MTASPTATMWPPEPLPRLRSRGGSGAGSSDYPGRRNPRAVGRRPESANAELLATATAALLAQRSFRAQQLQQLGEDPPEAEPDAARSEIHMALQAAARSALRDIDAALRRIRRGNYGRCPTCGDALSVERLRAVPMTSHCERCQRAAANAAAAAPKRRTAADTPSRHPREESASHDD